MLHDDESSSSNSAFSSELYWYEEADVVVVVIEVGVVGDLGKGSSSSKVAFSFDGSGGDGMMLSKLELEDGASDDFVGDDVC